MSASTVLDILDVRPDQNSSGKEAAKAQRKSKKPSDPVPKRPEGMSREVFALLCADSRDPPPIMPSDTARGYKAAKAKLGRASVRRWKWMPFTNPARSDNLMLSHWRKAADEGKEYPFAKLNRKANIYSYTDEEYDRFLKDDHLHEQAWSRAETDHLFDLCRRFDLRFVVVHDRYDYTQFQRRSMEDLKERYYDICNKLAKARAPAGEEAPLVCAYDAQHETLRKQQLLKLYSRTREQVQEEQYLLTELKKIESRRKERERKQQELHKLMAAAENTEKRSEKRRSSKKRAVGGAPHASLNPGDSSLFKSFDKSTGVSLRSSRLRVPASLTQKKSKLMDAIVDDLGVGVAPMPTEGVCVAYNELRTDILLLLELKSAADTCEFELQALKHKYEAMLAGTGTKGTVDLSSIQELSKPASSTLQIIDTVSTPPAGANMRKRRATTTLLDTTLLKRSRKA